MAADLHERPLEALKRFRVVVPKASSGHRVEFGRYEFENDAKRAALLLRWAGAPAVVIGPQGELDLVEVSR